MSQPLISVIVPVYNIEKYIRKCIESVLSQTYTNLELLLIDDGSQDKSGYICDEYATKDKRVKVFHKENGGVSSARNVGLEEMSGTWVCFLDSDDWWSPHFLQNFIEETNDNNYDLILQGYIEENEIHKTRRIISLPECNFNTACELIVFLEKAKNIHNGFLWHRLFKANIFKEQKIRFALDFSYAEDGDVFFRYLKHAPRSRITNKYGYHYRRIENTLTSKGKYIPHEIFYKLIKTYTFNISQIIEKEKPSQKILNNLQLYQWRLLISWQIKKHTIDYNFYREQLQSVQEIIRKHDLNQTSDMPFHIKALSTICLSKSTFLNFTLIKAIIKYRELKQRIENKLNNGKIFRHTI